ncbi:DNA cytosine methyltransferase [Microbacterium sp. NPDC058021]|uniref:DNA cytosine methyltransferase n=1 Tax=Microbacterium sp. NPDC058021 TaxID=3346306 RepID=UPI0036DD88F2
MPDVLRSHPLLQRAAPRFDDGKAAPVRIVDLFAGCGGLTLGAAQAASLHDRAVEIALAVDFEPLATEVYRRNFPFASNIETGPVEMLFDGDTGSPPTFAEKRVAARVGEVDIILGGPPCQGHSSLNNHTRQVDEKNALYLRMVRAAEILTPRVVIIENVPAVRNDRHNGEGVVARAERRLMEIGYRVAERIIELEALGVAQRRRRHVLLAVAESEAISPESLFEAMPTEEPCTLRWAIGDLLDIGGDAPWDREPQAKRENLERMRYLLDNDEFDLPNRLRPKCHQGDHSYKSMYGRLRWDEPAQTITSGFGSIGQGRFMHPERARALTAHEASRIQGFPDYFDFSSCPTRHALATMIGNAVPPALSAGVVNAYLALAQARSESSGQLAAMA